MSKIVRRKKSMKNTKRKRLSKLHAKQTFKHINKRKSKGGSIQKIPETIDNVALLIPVHPPHYTQVYTLLNKIKDNNIHIDIYCIFSNRGDYDTFTMKDMIKEIIPESVPDDNSIISFKKLYGLKYMVNTKYDFIILCDSETDIIVENFTKDNITQKISNIFINKRLYGIYMGDFYKSIMSACANVYTGDDYTKIESATKNLRLYTFFYNIPVYKREHIQGFLDKIKYDTLKITWYHFDTLMYDYFLVVTQSFEIVDVSSFAHDSDGLYVDNIDNLKKLKEFGLEFGSVVGNFWRDKSEILKEEKTFLLVNIDRLS